MTRTNDSKKTEHLYIWSLTYKYDKYTMLSSDSKYTRDQCSHPRHDFHLYPLPPPAHHMPTTATGHVGGREFETISNFSHLQTKSTSQH